MDFKWMYISALLACFNKLSLASDGSVDYRNVTDGTARLGGLGAASLPTKEQLDRELRQFSRDIDEEIQTLTTTIRRKFDDDYLKKVIELSLEAAEDEETNGEVTPGKAVALIARLSAIIKGADEDIEEMNNRLRGHLRECKGITMMMERIKRKDAEYEKDLGRVAEKYPVTDISEMYLEEEFRKAYTAMIAEADTKIEKGLKEILSRLSERYVELAAEAGVVLEDVDVTSDDEKDFE